MDVPWHLPEEERARQLPLVTDSATVTLVEAMDRSRNKEVLSAVRDQLDPLDGREWLGEFRDGSDVRWASLTDRCREAGATASRVDRIETLAERFERPYPSLLRLRVRPDVKVDFSPGQYIALRVDGTPRAYSLANSPSEDELELCIRRVPGGRLTSDLFQRVDEGDEVGVRGPNGEMVLESPSDRDVVFLATGTGVAPFKSMLDFTFEADRDSFEGEPRDVWLFLGCAWEDDLPYREAFRELDATHDHFHFVPTLTREPLLSDWEGATDYVQQVFVDHVADDALAATALPDGLDRRDAETATDARIDPANVELYACGITAMVSTLVDAALAVGVPADSMQYEGFG
ncbi:FAD-binding oxidoreductase [Haloarcula litorea]|uniref:FAD-binding oxidoreductase n=1 Tax=Haloarcula litorea TaxID=3032579 RepID=UPI0023E7F1C5|nr:FAD-binding oxidoreductase [Halomicroarcula sp. GDY20]